MLMSLVLPRLPWMRWGLSALLPLVMRISGGGGTEPPSRRYRQPTGAQKDDASVRASKRSSLATCAALPGLNLASELLSGECLACVHVVQTLLYLVEDVEPVDDLIKGQCLPRERRWHRWLLAWRIWRAYEEP